MTVTALVLAAGTASRFGATKQLALLEGEPLVAKVVAIAHEAGCDAVMVVVGHDAGHVGMAIVDRDVTIVRNPDYHLGQATSLGFGLRVLEGGFASAAVVLLADEPTLDPDVVRRCIRAWSDGATVARPRFRDRVGHPVVLDRSVWRDFRDATGDTGGREVLSTLDVTFVDVDTDGPRDIDTPGDLADHQR